MKRHLNRSRKALLAIAAGVMLAAGAAFLSAGSSHHFSGVDSEDDCAYMCSQLGHGYTYYDSWNCCECN